MVKRLLLVLGLCVQVTALAAPARAQVSVVPITYEEALIRMREANETLRAADEEILQRQEERAATRGLYWPEISLHGQATHLDDRIVLDLDPIRQAITGLHRLPAGTLPPFESTFQKQNFWVAQLTTTWPVYTGGKVQAANRAAALQVVDAEQRKQMSADTLSTELARRYFALRLAMRAREVRAGVLAALDRHMYEATRLEQEGLIARAERLHAAVARSKAARELQATDQDVAMAQSALASLLSTPDAVEPATELFLLSDAGALSAYQNVALQRHPGLQRLATQRDLAGEHLRAERGKWRPDVALFGMRELHTSDVTLVSPTWAAGIAASFTVFDGFERGHRIAAAKRQQSRVDQLAARARRDITTLVELKFRTMTKAREQYVSLDAALELAGEMVRVRSRAFEEGFATSLEVVDARLTLEGVTLQRLVAAYEFDVALAELLEASGEPGRFPDLRQRADLHPER